MSRFGCFDFLKRTRNSLKFVTNLHGNVQPSRQRSYSEIYHDWILKFSEAGIPEPEESAGYIIAHLMGLKTFSVIPRKTILREMPEHEIVTMNHLCEKRLQRMPVQYVIGEWDFFGVNLKMKPPVLIPRPETEELTQHVLKDIEKKMNHSDYCKVLEVGCGTGAITLSLLSKLNSANVSFLAIDSSKHAYTLTLENARLLGLDKSPKLSVLLHDLKGDDVVLAKFGQFDIVVSNPPYISTEDMKDLPEEISRYEDQNALHGGQTGLDVINIILKVAKFLLKDDGLIWLEVDPPHCAIIADEHQDFSSNSYEDIFGKDRFCRLTKLKGAT